jgi:hypothetical protein
MMNDNNAESPAVLDLLILLGLAVPLLADVLLARRGIDNGMTSRSGCKRVIWAREDQPFAGIPTDAMRGPYTRVGHYLRAGTRHPS